MKNDDAALMKTIAARLKGAKIDDATLGNVLKTVKELHGKDVAVTRIFPLGTIAPDGVSVEAELGEEQLAVVAELLKEAQNYHGIEVFPIGIIAPNRFRAIVNMR